MKKLFFCMVVTLMIISVSSFAQQAQGYVERMVQMYKDSLQLTNVQTDSFTAVIQQFMPLFASASIDKSLTNDEKKSKLKELTSQLKVRYRAILSSDQYAKLEAMGGRARPQMNNPAPGGN